jgi:hypothetical protein
VEAMEKLLAFEFFPDKKESEVDVGWELCKSGRSGISECSGL